MKNFNEDNIRFINQLDKLLKQKEEDYGSFDRTSWVMTQLLENVLTAHNGVKVKVSIKIFGIFMIMLKLWRILSSKRYLKDNFDDIAGYDELLRKLVIQEENKIPMTPKLMKVLKYIKKYYTKHEMSPTRRKMQVDLGYKSPNSISVLVDKLVARGDLVKIGSNKARNLELNGKGK